MQPADALDIIQNTFIQVIRKIDQYQGQASFRSWVFRIAYRQMLNHQTANRMTPAADLEPVSQEPTAEQQLLASESSQQMWESIDQLPESQRQVIWLRMYENMTFREIAEITDASINTVLSRMHQAKQKLQKQLVDCGLNLGVAK